MGGSPGSVRSVLHAVSAAQTGEVMKILMVAPTPFFANRGCHIRILSEIRALQGLGHAVSIVTYHIGETPDGVDAYRIPRVPWYRKLEAGPSWQKPFLDLLLIFRTWSMARKLQPDVLYGHLHEGAFVAHMARLLLRRRPPLLFDVQDSLTAELRSYRFVRSGSFAEKFFLKLEQWICEKADHLVCSSRSSAELIRKEFSAEPSRVETMEDGVDRKHFVAPKRNGLRENS